MSLKTWVVEHIVSLLQLLVALLGFLGIGKIMRDIRKNQSTSMHKSHGNTVIQAQRDVDVGDIENQIQGTDAEQIHAYASEGTEYEDTDRLVQKIIDAIDQDQTASTIAQMCLRLARDLDMEEDIRWLEKEVNGFDYGRDLQDTGPLRVEDTSEDIYKDYRKVKMSFSIMDSSGEIHNFDPFYVFVGQPLVYIENVLSQATQEDILIQMPPLQAMAEGLGIDPEERVPYQTKKSRLESILLGAKREFHNFVMRVKEEHESN